MNGNGQNLTRNQQRAIPIIVSARTITEGVKLAGISKTQFYEWMKQEHFRQEFVSKQNHLVETALSLILEHTAKIRETEEIETRLKALEERLLK